MGTLVGKTLVIAGEAGYFTAQSDTRGAMGLRQSASERIADDLHAERQTVYRDRDQPLGRIAGVPATGLTILA